MECRNSTGRPRKLVFTAGAHSVYYLCGIGVESSLYYSVTNYIVNPVNVPVLPPDWGNANVLTDFPLRWPGAYQPTALPVAGTTQFRALWDAQHLHFHFAVATKHVRAHRELGTKFDALASDRVEIFFKVNGGMNPYYGLEIDVLGRVFDFKADFHRQFQYHWRWNGVHAEAVRNAAGYTVEGRIPMASLRALGILDGRRIEAGLYRAASYPEGKDNFDFLWMSWIDPGTPTPDFHVPASFGTLLLADA